MMLESLGKLGSEDTLSRVAIIKVRATVSADPFLPWQIVLQATTHLLDHMV